MSRKPSVHWLCGLVLLCGIAGARAQETPPAARTTVLDAGLASVYAPRLQGRQTASGERYNHYALTAAHRTLPLGTRVRVENLDNGRTVTVRINDRGPYVEGRILDVSGEAARRLGLRDLARVRLLADTPAPVAAAPPPGATPAPAAPSPAALPPPARPAAETFVIQLASFQDLTAATTMAAALDDAWVQEVAVEGARRYRVNYGSYPSETAALQARQALQARGIDGFVKHLDPGAAILPDAAPPAAPPPADVVYNTWSGLTLQSAAVPPRRR